MARALIQVANQSTQTVAENSIISLGSVQRRFGCNLRLSGNGIEAEGAGYYAVDCAITAAPTEAGAVTVALYENGAQIPGAVATGTAAAAGDAVALYICATFRQGCCCDAADNITVVLQSGAGTVENISLRITKE